MTKPHIMILGAGPAGLGAAFQLTRRALARVTVVERNSWVGGNAGSFEVAGMRVDYGSHRLHPSCDAAVLRDLRALLGPDLLDRPRHGRIRLQGRWIHFPLRPLDLCLRLPPRFVCGVGADLLRTIVHGRRPSLSPDIFATALEQGLGRTICRNFYFPYARKVWGLEPEELSATQAQRRVSASSLAKMMQKALAAVPGFKPAGSGRFFYPRYGYGQIAEVYAQAAQDAGATILLNTRVQAVQTTQGVVRAVRFEQDGQVQSLQATYVWSTIPMTSLARCLEPGPPPESLQAAESLDYRAMILIYLVVEQERFSEYDAHYFPEPDIPIARLSEPKNYRNGAGPPNLTVLCAELPCAPDGPEWQMKAADLGGLVRAALEVADLPIRAPVKEVVMRRLRHAYPLYRRGYEVYFQRLDQWLSGIEGLLSFGRQGLFAHDNTHHALAMAYRAVDCLDVSGAFDRDRWQAFRRVFESHVVED